MGAVQAAVEGMRGLLEQLARDFELPAEAVEAALVYYRENKEYIVPRLLLGGA